MAGPGSSSCAEGAALLFMKRRRCHDRSSALVRMHKPYCSGVAAIAHTTGQQGRSARGARRDGEEAGGEARSCKHSQDLCQGAEKAGPARRNLGRHIMAPGDTDSMAAARASRRPQGSAAADSETLRVVESAFVRGKFHKFRPLLDHDFSSPTARTHLQSLPQCPGWRRCCPSAGRRSQTCKQSARR